MNLNKLGIGIAIAISSAAVIAGVILPLNKGEEEIRKAITYKDIAPYVSDYLEKNDIVNTDGKIIVPDEYNNTKEITVEEAVNRLVEDGSISYLKEAIENDGTETSNSASDNIVATGAALNNSGGVLSLTSCEVNQVLSYDGSSWVCATVSKNGVDENTTNTVANMKLTNGVLQVSITDSNGNTVSTNKVDFESTFLSSADLSNYATTANLNTLAGRVTTLENNDYVDEDWVNNKNYLTSSELSTYLNDNDYVTDSALNTILSSYLLKNQFATYLNTNLKAGTGISISSDNTITSLHNADIFTVVEDHLTVSTPDVNKIYLDTSTDPIQEWIYLNGANGAPTDPTDPTAWTQVGSLAIDLSQYPTTAEMNTAISNALSNQLSDLANNSNLNDILSDYLTSEDLDDAMSSANGDMATKTWVNEQGFLTSDSLTGNATESWVNSQNFAKQSSLNNFYTKTETDSLVNNKADQSALDSTNVKVSALEAALSSKQDTLTAGDNITISGSVISANVDLSAYATKTYVDSQDFLTNSAALASYATQSYVNSQGFITNAALSGYATEDWVTTYGYLTSTDLNPYAKMDWVTAQNYLDVAGLEDYLDTNGYVTDHDVANLLLSYVSKAEFADVLNYNLKAGSGINISSDNTITSTVDTDFVSIVPNHLEVTNAVHDKIYLDSGTNPIGQWIYLNGTDGAPTDPTNPAAWMKVGDVTVDLSGYSTTEQMNTAITNALKEQYDQLQTELAQYATEDWVDSQGFLTSTDLIDNATQSWVSQNYVAQSTLTDYATKDWVTSQGYLKSAALSNYVTQDYVTNQGYLTSTALSGYATQTWVTGQGYLTTASADATYVTKTSLTNTLAAYQPLITGGASTITTANLTANMLLQSNGDGKVAASGVSVSSLQTALTNITTLQSQVATNTTDIANIKNNSLNMGAWGEINTGKTFRGKPVYRQDFTLYITANAGVNSDLTLINTAGYVDAILNSGGYWSTGNQSEKFQVGGSPDNTLYGYVMTSTDNKLVFRSKSSMNRSSATTIIVVEYTKN